MNFENLPVVCSWHQYHQVLWGHPAVQGWEVRFWWLAPLHMETWLGAPWDCICILRGDVGQDAPGQPALAVAAGPPPAGTPMKQSPPPPSSLWRGGRPLPAGAPGRRCSAEASLPGSPPALSVPAVLMAVRPLWSPCSSLVRGLEVLGAAGRRLRRRREEGRKEGSAAGARPAQGQWTQVTEDPPWMLWADRHELSQMPPAPQLLTFLPALSQHHRIVSQSLLTFMLWHFWSLSASHFIECPSLSLSLIFLMMRFSVCNWQELQCAWCCALIASYQVVQNFNLSNYWSYSLWSFS